MAQATHYNFIGRKIETTVLAHQELFDYNGRIYLFVQGDRETYSFYYGFCEGEKILLEDKVDASLLSTTRAGGFVGVFSRTFMLPLMEDCLRIQLISTGLNIAPES